MEWLKKQNLKPSFMAITCLFLCVGILLAIGSVLICVQIRSSYLATPKYEIVLDEMGELSSFTEQQEKSVHAGADATLSILQMALPVFWVVLSLILADITFYNVKLKQPLSILQAGAERIQRQDLDFEIVSKSSDELGKLCASFEIMRRELKQNNQELWRQAEERKRLNAAFSHDLRNPVTVLKGSAKMLKKETDNFSITFLWEGIYYGLLASAIGAIFGSVCSIFIKAAATDTVQIIAIPVIPILQATVVSVIACLIATALPLRSISKTSVVRSILAVE